MTIPPASNKAPVPLSRYHLLTTSDLDELRQAVNSNYHPVRCDVGKASNFHIQYNHAFLKGISVSYHTLSDRLKMTSEPTEYSYILQFDMRRGRSTITYGHSTVEVSPKSGGSIISPTRECAWDYEKGQQQFIFRIERAVLERVFQAITGRTITEPLEFEHKIDTNDLKIANLKFVCRQMIQGLDGRDDFMHIPAIHTQVIDFFISGLLYAQPHNYSEFLTAPKADTGPRYIKEVEQYIRAHVHEPVRIPEIALHFGLNVRVLQAGFKKHRPYTMSQFIKWARLERAQYLLQYEPFRSVQEVAFACNYNYAGQFSADYKQKFGELPNEMRKRFL